jgi:predicted CoA-binding protein
MSDVPPAVARFLSGKRLAVAGVSRNSSAPANAIFKRLRDTGHAVFALNPNASMVEGEPCYRRMSDIPGTVDGLMVVTHPSDAELVVKEALARGITQVWFHRSFGQGSVSEAAVAACRAAAVEPIIGGCPLMYCGRIDPAHRVFRWVLRPQRRVPG